MVLGLRVPGEEGGRNNHKKQGEEKRKKGDAKTRPSYIQTVRTSVKHFDEFLFSRACLALSNRIGRATGRGGRCEETEIQTGLGGSSKVSKGKRTHAT